MLLLLGVILVDLLASRRFKAFKTSGREGQAAGLFAVLVLFALLMVLAAVTKF
jgi:hypothetical protein